MLAGHVHAYERMAPIDPDGDIDPRGVRQFVVGTGGHDFQSFSTAPTQFSEVNADETFGALRLILRPTGYEWRYETTPGFPAVLDTGSAECTD